MKNKPPLLIVMGPTASGKTAVALELAKMIPCDLISCDSMQVYKRMPILTQAPNRAEKKALKAHLISFLEPGRRFSAAAFRKEALLLIRSILKKGRTPLVSGGTGLYLRALLDGLFDSDRKGQDLKLRKQLMAEQVKHGGAYLHEKLCRLDAEAAIKIHPNDFRRLVRALEVIELSGKLFSQRKTERVGIRADYYCPVYFLERERQDLYGRINQRVDKMLKDGLEKEVGSLKRIRLSQTAKMALGLSHMKNCMDGTWSREEAIENLKRDTRRYAKRQLSWFRHEKGVVPVPVAPSDSPKKIASVILERWKKGMANG